MTQINPEIEESWKEALEQEFSKPYFSDLKAFLLSEKTNYTVYPPGRFIFNAFNLTPFTNVKAVILGQDPYHGPGQAHGLSFSVQRGVRVPPSLRNILQEIQSDLKREPSVNDDLSAWARQGVLLLNATLTVRAATAGSHQGKGWETFTDAVIKIVSEEKEHVVFLLWGRYAQNKTALIDTSKHLVLKAPHPSPLSAHMGFFGCRHFSRANEWLRAHGSEPVQW